MGFGCGGSSSFAELQCWEMKQRKLSLAGRGSGCCQHRAPLADGSFQCKDAEMLWCPFGVRQVCISSIALMGPGVAAVLSSAAQGSPLCACSAVVSH